MIVCGYTVVILRSFGAKAPEKKFTGTKPVFDPTDIRTHEYTVKKVPLIPEQDFG